MIDDFSKLWQGLQEHQRFQLWFEVILDFIPQERYYKFKSKFNTELMLVCGQKGPQKYYYKRKSKFNTKLMLVYGQKGPATDVMLHYVT